MKTATEGFSRGKEYVVQETMYYFLKSMNSKEDDRTYYTDGTYFVNITAEKARKQRMESGGSAYYHARANGGEGDNPTYPFPCDGTVKYVSPYDKKSKFQYTEGPKDREWMTLRDENYLRRLIETKAACPKEDREALEKFRQELMAKAKLRIQKEEAARAQLVEKRKKAKELAKQEEAAKKLEEVKKQQEQRERLINTQIKKEEGSSIKFSVAYETGMHSFSFLLKGWQEPEMQLLMKQCFNACKAIEGMGYGASNALEVDENIGNVDLFFYEDEKSAQRMIRRIERKGTVIASTDGRKKCTINPDEMLKILNEFPAKQKISEDEKKKTKSSEHKNGKDKDKGKKIIGKKDSFSLPKISNEDEDEEKEEKGDSGYLQSSLEIDDDTVRFTVIYKLDDRSFSFILNEWQQFEILLETVMGKCFKACRAIERANYGSAESFQVDKKTPDTITKLIFHQDEKSAKTMLRRLERQGIVISSTNDDVKKLTICAKDLLKILKEFPAKQPLDTKDEKRKQELSTEKVVSSHRPTSTKRKVQIPEECSWREPGHIRGITYSPNGKLLALTNRFSKVWVIDCETKKTIFENECRVSHNYHSNCVAFSPCGNLLAFQNGSYVEVVNIKKNSFLDHIKWSDGYLLNDGGYNGTWAGNVEGLVFSADGKWLAFGLHRNAVQLWNLEKKCLEKVIADYCYGSLSFSPDSTKLAMGCRDKKVRFYSPDGYRSDCDILKNFVGVSGVQFSPDGELLAVSPGRYEGVISSIKLEVTGLSKSKISQNPVKLWNIRSKQLLFTLDNTFEATITFSPDGQVLATITEEGLKLWNPKTGELMLTVKDVGCAAFSPDGYILTTVVIKEDDEMEDTSIIQMHHVENLLRKAHAKNPSTKRQENGRSHSVLKPS